MKTIYSRFAKETIAGLPRVLFEGRIVVIQSEGEAQRAVSFLRTFPRLGLDTETRPSFRPGAMHSVSLLQVSAPEICFLFRLNAIGLPRCIVELFTDRAVQKVGLSLHDDWAQLRRRADFEPCNDLELQHYVTRLGIEDMSLQKLYANLFGQKISKKQRLSNWEADVLSEAQKRYAATDAWACLQLYDEITRLLTTREYALVASQ